MGNPRLVGRSMREDILAEYLPFLQHDLAKPDMPESITVMQRLGAGKTNQKDKYDESIDACRVRELMNTRSHEMSGVSRKIKFKV
jgi:hypothetical protein